MRTHSLSALISVYGCDKRKMKRSIVIENNVTLQNVLLISE